MQDSKLIEVLRSQCRYHVNFTLAWTAFTIVTVYYGYSALSAFGGMMMWRHGSKAYGAYKTATILCDKTVVKVNVADESEIAEMMNEINKEIENQDEK